MGRYYFGQLASLQHDGQPKRDDGVNARMEGTNGAGDEAKGSEVGEGGDDGDGGVVRQERTDGDGSGWGEGLRAEEGDGGRCGCHCLV